MSLGHFAGGRALHPLHVADPRYPDWSCTACSASRVRVRLRMRDARSWRRNPETARHSSEMERRADDAERELLQWKKVRFMANKVGDEYAATSAVSRPSACSWSSWSITSRGSSTCRAWRTTITGSWNRARAQGRAHEEDLSIGDRVDVHQVVRVDGTAGRPGTRSRSLST